MVTAHLDEIAVFDGCSGWFRSPQKKSSRRTAVLGHLATEGGSRKVLVDVMKLTKRLHLQCRYRATVFHHLQSAILVLLAKSNNYDFIS